MQPPVGCTPEALSPGIKQLEPEADNSSPSIAKTKHAREFTFRSLCGD